MTKPSIAGHGLNWQHCSHMAFVGASYSYEMQYQAIRRCWRYGQEREVMVHRLATDADMYVLDAVAQKEIGVRIASMTTSRGRCTPTGYKGCSGPVLR